MSQELINIGTLPNDGTGDPLRTSFTKVNNNFSELYFAYTRNYEANTIGNTANQVILTYPLNQFTQATFQINTTNDDDNDVQNITIAATVNKNGTSVNFSEYGQVTTGNVLTTYSMDISAGNVRLMVSPTVNSDMNHFILAQISYQS